MTGGDGRGAEGGGQHLAFEADVEDAGTLGIEAGEAGQQQRRREPDGRVERREDDARSISAPSAFGCGDAGRRAG